ncbi:cyclin-like protein [Lipomyces tetrasporus]|uniref:Cyclin-like protein n=1 Tax=Lipomyces tetrasporus TaxID=54092 RepID=A0AAD7VSF9_9ASCO|nr:cyclin-like protein [Lipomyces tetrasporus]KAJ8100283.1 cyclin-like protein [Lipomyces tetrasporus]
MTASTDDDLYRQGSQYRLWSFTAAELSSIREKVNAHAIAKIKREHASQGLDDQPVEFLSVEEEQDLVLYYCGKVQDMAGVFKLPSHVKATAISYLKRFYLRYSVMEYHPKNILHTCLFLAAKAENHFISIENFTQLLAKVTPESILELEFTVAQALSFTLMVHHAFNPIHGYFLDIQSVFPSRIDEIGVAHDAARRFANDSLFSDVAFMFTPPQIALAALAMANDALIKDYLEVKFGRQSGLLEQLNTVIRNVRTYIEERARELSKERVVAIDKKLYFVSNPGKLRKRKADDDASAVNGDTKKVMTQKVADDLISES